jgi:hypothetical protein
VASVHSDHRQLFLSQYHASPGGWASFRPRSPCRRPARPPQPGPRRRQAHGRRQRRRRSAMPIVVAALTLTSKPPESRPLAPVRQAFVTAAVRQPGRSIRPHAVDGGDAVVTRLGLRSSMRDERLQSPRTGIKGRAGGRLPRGRGLGVRSGRAAWRATGPIPGPGGSQARRARAGSAWPRRREPMSSLSRRTAWRSSSPSRTVVSGMSWSPST